MQNSFVNVPAQNQVRLETEEIDAADLGPDQLLIETECTFISAGTELANYTGVEPKAWQPGSWCHYPWRSGYANVGVVRAAGPDVTRARSGDRVFTYARHERYPRYSEQRLVFPVPDDMPSDLFAASRMAGVAATAILVTAIRGAPTVAIFGLGIVGNLAAQMFRARGCRVLGIDPVPARRHLAEQVGVSETLSGTNEEVQAQIMERTTGQGADIGVDAVGHSAVCLQALAATRTLGQLVVLGTPRAPVEGNLTDFLGEMHYRSVRVLGALEWQFPMYPTLNATISQYEKQSMIAAWLREGRLQLAPLISHRLPPSAIETAYQGLLKDKNHYTGVVLQWP